MTVRFGLLGDVVADLDGQPLDLGHVRQRCVLVALLVDANRTVSVDQLIDRVWADHPPRRARDTLYGYLYRLRRALASSPDVAIVRAPGGYQLTVDVSVVDAYRFDRLVAQARADDDEQKALTAFDNALGLWRGDAFADLGSVDTHWLDAQRESMHAQRFAAELDQTDLALRLGRHGDLLAGLASRAAAHPLNERLAGQTMLALYRSGRQSEALEHYQCLRDRLADVLGVDPGPDLLRLHHQILTADPSLTTPDTLPVRGPVAVVPRQLPATAAQFAGRAREIATLTAQLEAAADAGSVVIVSVSGAAGIGKTTLVTHWAHRVRGRFPDGQLYVNLRGFDPSGKMVEPAEAVRGFLDALGVPPQRLPSSPEAQIALYRSLLDGKRILLVLDNARDAQQVRPLLPGTASAFVLVTSRDRLSSLVAVDGAHPINLGLLSGKEARELLSRRLGSRRIAVEPEAVRQLISRCARLPLALTIAAARAAQTGFPLSALAAELTEAGQRLDILSADDPQSGVRTVFSWSYTALTSMAARLFRLLGLHPGPDVSVAAAASLAALPLAQTRRLLAELSRVSLLAEHMPSRYTFSHGLLRDYAIDQAHTGEPEHERHAATHRMLDHYLHTAYAAARLVKPGWNPLSLPPPQPGVAPEQLADPEWVLAWFTTERAVLRAVTDHSAAAGFDAHAWQLAQSLVTFLDRHGHWHDLAAIGNVAEAAAYRLADPAAQALAHRISARALLRLGHLDDAQTHLDQALELFGRAGDLARQADTHIALARVWARRGPHALTAGLYHVRQAHKLHHASGHRAGQAQALNAIGWAHARLGNHAQALVCCRQALSVLEELDDREGQTFAWDSIGFAHHHLGHHRQAVTCYRRALDLCQNIGDRYLEADILTRLGGTHHATHDLDATRDTWQHALGILTELEHPDAEQVRSKLATLDIPHPAGT
ncbi:AAA family ATPase [Dactylosporangium roseum]|uniref:AAA family ATPase n=1 Tax=Dactylosporangium roseum TaxID=47989 RepID=A0ABY5YYR0_9ACTN|nr:BTAD domain-containing putative transcriptional regulator [Dactylosporangium roseum]UWZ34652.1 AAA family ATPase [Dactylosporangium roseum]